MLISLNAYRWRFYREYISVARKEEINSPTARKEIRAERCTRIVAAAAAAAAW